MRVSILTETGDLHHLEFDSQMEIENIKALLEADVSLASHLCSFSPTLAPCQRKDSYFTDTLSFRCMLSHTVQYPSRGAAYLPQRQGAPRPEIDSGGQQCGAG